MLLTLSLRLRVNVDSLLSNTGPFKRGVCVVAECLTITEIPFVLNVVGLELFDGAYDSLVSHKFLLKVESDTVSSTRLVVQVVI